MSHLDITLSLAVMGGQPWGGQHLPNQECLVELSACPISHDSKHILKTRLLSKELWLLEVQKFRESVSSIISICLWRQLHNMSFWVKHIFKCIIWLVDRRMFRDRTLEFWNALVELKVYLFCPMGFRWVRQNHLCHFKGFTKLITVIQ